MNWKAFLVAGLALPLAAQGADLRVAHVSPDAPNVDVWLDGSVVLNNVPYGAFSGYQDIDAGMHQVQVFATGTSMDPVIDATLDFAEGSATTVAATGLLSDDSFGPLVLSDTRDTDPSMAWVRFVHTAADAPAVDITLADGTVLFEDVEFNEFIDYTPVHPGSYSLQVRIAGTEDVVLSFEPVSLDQGTTYSVLAKGTLADGTLGAWATVDAPGPGDEAQELSVLGTSLRVAHLSEDAPAVDVWLDGAEVLSDVSYPAFSPYLDIMAGSRNVQVFVAGTTTDPVIDATLDFAAGSATTVAATGLLADESFGPVVLSDTRLTDPDEAWVRFVHTGADAPAVDITLADGTVLFGDIEFNESAMYTPVMPMAYDLEVRLAGTQDVVLAFEPVELMAGTTYTVWATGTLANSTLGAWATVDAPGAGDVAIELGQLTSVGQELSRPDGVHINPAYPNPFNPTTSLRFELAQSGDARLAVYNLQGQLVSVLYEGGLQAGSHSLVWNASGLASGRYIALLESNRQRSIQSLTLVK